MKVNQRWKLPAGKYWVGDPCYVIRDSRWSSVIEQMFDENSMLREPYRNSGVVKVEDTEVVMFGTAHGDGEYYDEDGRAYCVDAGMIGCVPALLIEADQMTDANRLGSWFEMPEAFICETKDGTLVFGHVGLWAR